MNLLLERATPKDAPKIAEIRNLVAKHMTDLYGKGHWSYQVHEKEVLFDMKGPTVLYFAKENEVIVGTLLLQAKKPWAIDTSYFTKMTQPVYLTNMAVLPSQQLKGIGRFMLEEIQIQAKFFPANAIRLDAYDNVAGAGDFYKKCGFMERGKIVFKNNPLVYYEMLL